MKHRHHILVVDDDKRLRQLLDKYLSENGFLITTVASTEDARKILNKQSIDLVILDLMMPEESGLEFLESFRKNLDHPKHNVPILMLTALGEVEHRIDGLEKGADDYLSKPFEPKELLLRLHRILSRSTRQSQAFTKIVLGKRSYDLNQQLLLEGTKPIYLTSVEQALMQIFANNPGFILSREELAERAGVSLSPRTVDVQITRLRKKIESNPKQPLYLQTVRHQGYVLRPDQ